MNNSKLIDWVLRISVAGEFIGHGVFALQGKKDWIGWFAKFGVADAGIATQLLFIIGAIDIALALLILIRPRSHRTSVDGILGFLDRASSSHRRHARMGFRRALG